MKEYLIKAKTNRTLYHDYDDSYLDLDSPKQMYEHYKLGEHYSLLRKGTVLYFIEQTDEDAVNSYKYIGETKKGNGWIGYGSIEDIKKCHFLDILEDNTITGTIHDTPREGE
jgi:hypothetical protein